MEITIILAESTELIYRAMLKSRKRDKIDNHITKIFAKKDFSLLEHANIHFDIQGISRACANQLTRYRIGVSFTQQSMRYVKIDTTADWFVTPRKIEEKNDGRYSDLEYFQDEMEKIGDNYLNLLDAGFSKEDARAILPLATKTELIFSCNMRALMHFLEQRLAANAQEEIRTLAILIVKTIKAEHNSWYDYLQQIPLVKRIEENENKTD